MKAQAAAKAAPVKTSTDLKAQQRRSVVPVSQFASGILQRTCACGSTPGPSGECTECRKKRLVSGLQAKLAVSQPGDRWEQEADRMAEAAIAGSPSRVRSFDPATTLRVQPGQIAGFSKVPASVYDAVHRPGQPLDPQTRTLMEARLGYDFRHVRLHNDQQAAQSAREVNALAYTVGKDVVFGPGQFAPHTHAGQRLLAHELAHTVQQGSTQPLIQRQAASFRVEGLHEGRGSEPNFVYFDLGRPSPTDNPPESALDSAEEAKVENKAHEALTANDQEISLYGFASEEGGASVNTPLIDRRLDAVQNVLVREGFQPPRTVRRQHNLGCSTGKYDYRFWRVVEMQRGTTASTRTCTPSATQPTACATRQASDIESVRSAAHQLIVGPNGALARLDRYIQNQSSEPVVATALDRYFGNNHSVQTATDVRARVDAIRVFLEALAPSGTASFLCGTMDEPTCHTGSPANASRSQQRVTICPTFFTNPKYNTRQEEILIHESSHASSFATDDRAYQRERVILILSTQQALANAQSITDFILEMNGRAPALGPEHPDQIAGCTPRRERLIREALAWAQRWNTYAMFGTAQTYGNVNNTAAMSPYINAHFGRSDPATIAGIYDRYRAMDGWFKEFYDIRCMSARHCSTTRSVNWTLTRAASPSGGGPLPQPTAAGSSPASPSGTTGPAGGSSTTAASSPTAPAPTSAPVTAATPAGNITICPQFFRLGTLYDRTVEMYSGLAMHMPGVSASQSRSYARLAYNYKTEFWGVR